MGDAEIAAAHHIAALDAADDARDPASVALALEGLASVTRDDVAAVLLGGAAELRRNAPVESAETSHRDDVIIVDERLRGRLGSTAFTDAYERGQAMTTGDLIALARSGVS